MVSKKKSETKTKGGAKAKALSVQDNSPRVVGIGASAGGLKACRELLEHLPAHSGMAFVVVPHRHAAQKSYLADVLSTVTEMPVEEVTRNTRVEPNHVYLNPPSTNMTIEKDVLRPSLRENGAVPHNPIDYFLNSLAKEKHNGAIGAILSGTGSDGTLGLKAIKTEGGITFAQDQKSALYFDMPRSAVNAGCVDFKLTPAQIAEELARLARHPGAVTVEAARREESLPLLPNGFGRIDSYHEILQLLHKMTGVDPSHYQPKAIQRCIRRRKALQHLRGLKAYAAYLRSNEEEVDALYKELIGGATGFFRDAEAITILKNKIFPKMVKHRTRGEPLRVWLPGCGTGEEAYSVAIAFHECVGNRPAHIPIQVFATDSNVKAIEHAKAGIYAESIDKNVSPERLRRFFVKTYEGYQISKPIRNLCIFARQDLLTDPPFSRMDLVVFLNKFNGFIPDSQKKAILALHYALKPTGLLLIDLKAMPRSTSSLFKLEHKKPKIYSKRGEAAIVESTPRLAKARLPEFAAKRYETQLQQELESARAYLKSVLLQHEIDTEELRTANEELQSSNEELESINEELETTHDELQSRNEELARSHEKTLQINNDSVNLLSSIQMPIIMVDRDLRIQRFTPTARALFNIVDADVGRLFTDLSLNVDLPQLPALVRQVMDTLQTTEQEIQNVKGTWYSLQVRPYKTPQHRIEGAVITMVDIDQLKRDREKLHLLVEVSFEPIIVWNFDNGGVVEWNQGCERLYGFTRDEAVGRNIHELLRTVHPLPHPEFMARLAVQGGWRGELRLTTRDGREVIVESRKQTAEIGGRRVVLETDHDITEIRRAELNARFIKQLDLEIAQINNADEIVRLATHRLGEYLGATRCRLSEINREADVSIVHKNWEGWLEGVPSLVGEYRIRDYITPETRAALEAGQAIIIDNVTSDPRTRDFAAYATLGIGAAIFVPTGTQGQWEATLTAAHSQPRNWRPDEEMLMRDTAIRVWLAVQQSRLVAALRESEARARRTLAEQMVAGVAECDRSGKFTLVNQRYCDITGRTKAELLEMRISDITHPDDWPHNAELIRRLFEDGESFLLEKRYLRKDGSETWVNTHSSPIRNAQGKIEEAVAVVVDVTDRKRAENELRSAYERAEAATRAKDEFLSLVSHELRTPMSSILGYTQLLNVQPPDSALIRRVVDVVEKNTRIQLQLIADLLDTTRIISGKLKLLVQPLDLADVIKATLDVVQPAAQSKGIELRSALDPLAAQITGDPERLQQTVWNLLSNAIKYTPQGGVVELTLDRVDPYVKIVVRDTGKGIDREFLPHVFERFRQSDMSSTRRTGGLGLGLALVKHIVELHGGTVEAASAGVNEGATFTVRLPVRAVYAPPQNANRRESAHHRETVSLADVRVLVVDDEQEVRTLLTLTLETYGAKVQAASSGKEAIELLFRQTGDEQFDVLICDIAMPDQDGYAVMRQVRALPPDKGGDIPAIALTAYGRPEYHVRILKAGFQMHAVKPVKPDELIDMILQIYRPTTTLM
jgi:PAS domain S-box-containing protein